MLPMLCAVLVGLFPACCTSAHPVPGEMLVENMIVHATRACGTCMTCHLLHEKNRIHIQSQSHHIPARSRAVARLAYRHQHC